MSPPTPPAFAAPCHPSTGADYVEPSAPLEATAVECRPRMARAAVRCHGAPNVNACVRPLRARARARP